MNSKSCFKVITFLSLFHDCEFYFENNYLLFDLWKDKVIIFLSAMSSLKKSLLLYTVLLNL